MTTKAVETIINSAVSSSKYSVIRVFKVLDDLYSNTSPFPPSSTRALLFQSLDAVFMFEQNYFKFFVISLEWFLYGKISALFFTLYPC